MSDPFRRVSLRRSVPLPGHMAGHVWRTRCASANAEAGELLVDLLK